MAYVVTTKLLDVLSILVGSFEFYRLLVIYNISLFFVLHMGVIIEKSQIYLLQTVRIC